MAIGYSQLLKQFRKPTGPVNVISEDEYGHSEDGFLVYPNVTSCTTITVMLDDNAVFGTHLTIASLGPAVDAILDKINETRGARNVAQLNVVGVLGATGSGWRGTEKYSGKKLFATLNEAFGRPKAAPIFVHDQTSQHSAGDIIHIHYRVICGHNVLGWFWKSSKVLYPNPGVSINGGFYPPGPITAV